MAKIVIAKETAYAQLDRLKTLHTSIMREIKQEIKETKALVKKKEGFYVKINRKLYKTGKNRRKNI